MAPDKQIGPYRILDVLGEGGMGTVFLAEQTEPVRRRVALKVIKLGMDSQAVLRRFELERQALALMQHDSIAKVFDCGTTAQGQPFFAMEYVKGVALTTYCDRQRLSLPDRLLLFQQVCSAVQHAHQKGVVHRDLKPSNVLVTDESGRAVPKVIDFGLARATNHMGVQQSLFTEIGQVIGTPEDTSPEQADPTAADVDTRTDVYSLGVILHELLTGQLPFSGEDLRRAGLLEMQRVIREVEPMRPSTRLGGHGADTTSAVAAARRTSVGVLHRALRNDLDWVILRAMEKDRNRRYESAAGLAADLQRFLDHEPLVAGPPSTAYRLRKLAARNRGLLAAALIVFLALAAGLVTTSWQYVRAEDNAGVASRMASAAQVALARSEMADLNLATFWCASSIYEARMPSLEEVQNHRAKNLMREDGDQQPSDPWGQAYELVPGEPAGTWAVRSPGPDRVAGTSDDLVQRDAVIVRRVAEKLDTAARQRARDILDACFEWTAMRRPGPVSLQELCRARGNAYATDPWGNEMNLAVEHDNLRLRSSGPDRLAGNEDDIVVVNVRTAESMSPEQALAARDSGRYVQCAVSLKHPDVTAYTIVNNLRPRYAASSSRKDLGRGTTLIFGAIGERILLVTGLAAEVVDVLDYVALIDAQPGEPPPPSPWEVTAKALIVDLRNRLVFRQDVIAALRADQQLEDRVLGAALVLAAAIQDTPEALNESAWAIVSDGTAAPERQALALRAAVQANAALPDKAHILNTLGVALYRTQDYRAAVETLRRCDAVHKGEPADVAFLAMALLRLGEREAAEREYARLQELMRDQRHAGKQENRSFLAEAAAAFGR